MHRLVAFHLVLAKTEGAFRLAVKKIIPLTYTREEMTIWWERMDDDQDNHTLGVQPSFFGDIRRRNVPLFYFLLFS